MAFEPTATRSTTPGRALESLFGSERWAAVDERSPWVEKVLRRNTNTMVIMSIIEVIGTPCPSGFLLAWCGLNFRNLLGVCTPGISHLLSSTVQGVKTPCLDFRQRGTAPPKITLGN